MTSLDLNQESETDTAEQIIQATSLPSTIDTKLTPMMQQWKGCKEQAPDAILFFRLGDFYEAFYEDAEQASKELDLTLTQRQEIPMCGIPWHTSEGYIERLVLKGFKVAIAEQVEDPKKAKGLVSRRLTRIVSPATLASQSSGEQTNSFFAAVTSYDNRYGLALCDLVTASFWVFECASARELVNELFRQGPKELLISTRFQGREGKLMAELLQNTRLLVSAKEDWLFDPSQSIQSLCQHFSVQTLDGFGLKEMKPGPIAAGALIQYLRDWQMCPVDHLKILRPYLGSQSLQLDRQTLVNLEVLEPIDKNHPKNCLRAILDATKTPMGSRLLTEWLKNPLVSKPRILARLDAVAAFSRLEQERPDVAALLDAKLDHIRDLEKLMFRIKTKSSGPREFAALKQSLEQIPLLKEIVANVSSELVDHLRASIDPCKACHKLIADALVDCPPFKVADGGLFRDGYNLELDELVRIKKHSKEWLVDYQTQLRAETGIKTLKVGFNRMFGYYIEVSRGAVDKMPDTLVRRQTLVNGERYISEELKRFEDKILTADSRIAEIEEELFATLRTLVSNWHDAILTTAASIAAIDVLRGFSIAAKRRGFVRPEITESRILDLADSRHPVIETLCLSEHFVPNDLYLDGKESALLCLTGPNMAGKSTYIRQVALLVIMAQTGSFVAANKATIGIVDKLFSRIGASDDLARGHSTFMVEMAETASILNQATERSLVILDEIGRGTSTYDGISIAWAVAEFLLRREYGTPKTLFATHYFELTELKNKLPGVQNATVAISETANGIVFLRKVIPGVADKSYGIHVARLAGMPEAVIQRASQMLSDLEKNPKKTDENQKKIVPDLFAQVPENRRSRIGREVVQKILETDLFNMTPIDALNRIHEWKKQLQ